MLPFREAFNLVNARLDVRMPVPATSFLKEPVFQRTSRAERLVRPTFMVGLFVGEVKEFLLRNGKNPALFSHSCRTEL
jgi:hypothetical protein